MPLHCTHLHSANRLTLNDSETIKHVRGFALVTSLIFVSLIMMLCYYLHIVYNLELKATALSLQQAKARKNAEFGMQMALQELQRQAGPDNRISASEIHEPDGNSHKNASSIWDSISGERVGKPLVSTQARKQEDSKTITEDIILYQNDSGIDRITAEKIYFNEEKTNLDRNSIAWWIADNGRKAAITSTDNSQLIDSPDYDTETLTELRENIKNTSGHFQSIHSFFPEKEEYHPADEQIMNDFKKVFFYNDLYKVNHLSQLPAYKELISSSYHDFTSSSYFTATNTLDGKLKEDLSHLKQSENSSVISQFTNHKDQFIGSELQEIINFSSNHPKKTLKAKSSKKTSESLIEFDIHPLVPEFVFSASVYCHSSTDQLYLYYHLFTDIWNPYTRPLSLKNHEEDSPDFDYNNGKHDVNIQINGLPSITVINESQNIQSGSFQLPNIIKSIKADTTHSPGFLKPYSAPSSSYDGPYSGRGVFAEHIAELGHNAKTSDIFNILFSKSEIDIKISITTEDGQEKTIQKIRIKNIPEFNIRFDNLIGSPKYYDRFATGYSYAKRAKLNADNWSFGIHGKYSDEWNSVSDSLELLLSHTDIRKQQIEIDLSNPNADDGRFYEVRDINDLNRSQMMTNMDFFRSGGLRWYPPYRMARLFDLPGFELTSVGSLNQFRFKNMPSFALGKKATTDSNSQDEPLIQNLNKIYDRYFFSTIPRDTDKWKLNSVLPNTKIVCSETGRNTDLSKSPNSAEILYIKNGFNLNSTSKNAWKAVLSAVQIKDFKYTQHSSYDDFNKQSELNTEEANPVSLKNVYFSYPFNPGEYLESPNAPERDRYQYIPPERSDTFSKRISTRANHESFLQGFRELSNRQIDDLAHHIVNGIQEFRSKKKRPFLSVSEFVSTGIIDSAIRKTPNINKPAGSEKRIPENSPGSLTQSVIMNTLAPYLFARSDTFTIRAYGEHNAGLKSQSSIAFCEAVVQRTPSLINETLGRKFKISSFRWLNNPAAQGPN